MPKIKQYQPKGRSFFFSIKEKMKRIAKKEEKKAEKNPTKYIGEKRVAIVSLVVEKTFIVSNRLPPKIVGMARRKEKVIASCIFHPRKRAAAIVDPLRDNPGKSAPVCIKPINNTSLIL